MWYFNKWICYYCCERKLQFFKIKLINQFDNEVQKSQINIFRYYTVCVKIPGAANYLLK